MTPASTSARRARESGAPGAVPMGNTFDKYGSQNPAVRWLVARFQAALDELWTRAAPESVLDVGCGEGVITRDWAERLGDRRIVGIDLDGRELRTHWRAATRPNLEFRVGDATRLSFAAGEFDMTAAIEVLEHVADPRATLAEMTRVARRHLLVSVPREPLWRASNVARGAYWSALGNTPGHLNHWSGRAFVRMLGDYGHVDLVRSPLPWTIALVRVPR